jgi:heme/copper-type cytochrome/quinol oxidase subunit 3
MSIDQTPDGATEHAIPAHETSLRETPEEIAYELRAAEGSLWTGSRLAVGIAIMAMASLAFAYFYLRSSNNEDLWRPGGITAPTATGAAIFVVTLAAGAFVILGRRRLLRGLNLDWQVAGWTGVLAGLVAVGLQIWELTQLPFYPGSSGYASCFIGWAALNIGMLFAGIYWIETLLARALRLRRALMEEGGNLSSPLPAERLFRANVEGCAFFWGFMAVAAGFFWLLFYVL